MKVDYKHIGQRIRAIRKQKHLSQEQLAKMTNVGTSHICHIETGHSQVSVQVLVGICNALDVSADQLLCDHVVQAKDVLTGEIAAILEDCSNRELRALTQVLHVTKSAMRSNDAPKEKAGKSE